MSDFDTIQSTDFTPSADQSAAPFPSPETTLPSPVPTKSRAPLIVSLLALLVALAALAVACLALYRTTPAPEAESEDSEAVYAQPGTTISYKNRQLPAYAQVPVNQYDPAAFAWQDGRVVYNGEGAQPLVGIDVSYYQKDIDWQQVKTSGVDFAMIRVGYRGYGVNGNILPDSYFEQNIRGALDAGLKVGVYFFSQSINVWEAEEEAAFVLDAIRGYDITFPVVFDWEVINNANARTTGLSSEALTRCALAFCDKIEKAGYTPAVYFNLDLAYLNYDLGRLAQYPFWLAEYKTVPSFFYHFDMWQYSAKGSVPGIEGSVDLNLSFTDFSTKE